MLVNDELQVLTINFNKRYAVWQSFRTQYVQKPHNVSIKRGVNRGMEKAPQ